MRSSSADRRGLSSENEGSEVALASRESPSRRTEVECHGFCVPGRLGPGVHMSANLDERNAGGYSVAYGRDDTHFPVYVTAALAAVFFTAAWITGATYWLALAVTAAGFTYYKLTFLDTRQHT